VPSLELSARSLPQTRVVPIFRLASIFSCARVGLLNRDHFSFVHSAGPAFATVLVFVATLALLASVAGAAQRACDGSPIRPESLRASDTPVPTVPPESPRPLPVEINLQITKLNDIDERKSHFRFEGYGDFRWCDPRSAFDPEVEGEDVRRFLGTADNYPFWNVDLTVANGVGAVEVTRRLVEIHSDGSTRVSGYFNSEVAAPFDLRRFPFDRQTLEIQIESFTFNQEVLELQTSDDRVSFHPNLFLPEWRIEGITGRVEQTLNVRDRTPFFRVVVALHVAREWGFYVYKLWVPLFLIVALSWSTFWMYDESLASRIRLSATAFLTVVAYQFAISGNLPKVAYLTLMDRLMIASFVLIAMSAVQSMPVAKIRETNVQRAAAIDRISQWLFPLLYLGIIVSIALMY
jgi:hypothetical protein